MSKINLNVLQKYAFFALKWFFFGISPKPIPLPKSKPIKPVQTDESKSGFQYVPNECSDSSLTWQNTDFAPKTKAAQPLPAQNDTSEKNPQKEPYLSELDEKELLRRGLDMSKAIIIKPFWYDEINRFVASNQIQKKGFSESVLSRYYAAFNAVIYDSEISESVENQ